MLGDRYYHSLHSSLLLQEGPGCGWQAVGGVRLQVRGDRSRGLAVINARMDMSRTRWAPLSTDAAQPACSPPALTRSLTRVAPAPAEAEGTETDVPVCTDLDVPQPISYVG